MEANQDSDNEQWAGAEQQSENSSYTLLGSGTPCDSDCEHTLSVAEDKTAQDLLHSDSFQGGEEESKAGALDIDSCFNTSMSSLSPDTPPLDSVLERTGKWRLVKFQDARALENTPSKKNHSTTLHNNRLYVFGGYDGKKNHNTISVFNIEQRTWSTLDLPNAPSGRNGHTATLIDNRRVFIIGGWLGSGPFAADDLHILDLEALRWQQCPIKGEMPGPCNMHTADAIGREIFVF